MPGAGGMRMAYALIIPALNEAESIGLVVRQIPRGLFSQVIVVDNGSVDGTADVARAAGAQVVEEPRRGYGRACLAGLARIHPEIRAVAFVDGDLSDDPGDLVPLVDCFEQGHMDLVVGSRLLGQAEPGSLAPLQRFGNWLSTRLMRWIWDVSFTDLGPMRIVSREALRHMAMRDTDYGWTIEMQAKAARLKLRCAEIAVHYRRRPFGRSKVSGTVIGSLRAGTKILWTVFRCWRMPLADQSSDPGAGR